MENREKRDEELVFSHKDYVCTLAYRVAHMCELKQNLILREFGLTHQQTQILAFIYARKGSEVFQKEIEQDLILKSSSVTEQLNILEKSEYIQRKLCAKDKRAKQLLVTKKAEGSHERFLGSLVSVEEDMLKGMDSDEIEIFKKLFNKVYNNLKQTI